MANEKNCNWLSAAAKADAYEKMISFRGGQQRGKVLHFQLMEIIVGNNGIEQGGNPFSYNVSK